jgi:hypothetical protein
MTSIEERMKTKEELAEEYAKKEWPYWTTSEMFLNCKTDFLAGWDACNSAREKEEGWVSVEERLPEIGVKVLGYNEHFRIYEIAERWTHKYDQYVPQENGLFKKEQREIEYFGDNNVMTHWRPLPTPPKEETKQ